MEEPVVENKGEDPLDLPPGFRFHPTDEEIITCYLTQKVINNSFSAIAMGEADLNKCEPWDLPSKPLDHDISTFFFLDYETLFFLSLKFDDDDNHHVSISMSLIDVN